MTKVDKCNNERKHDYMIITDYLIINNYECMRTGWKLREERSRVNHVEMLTKELGDKVLQPKQGREAKGKVVRHRQDTSKRQQYAKKNGNSINKTQSIPIPIKIFIKELFNNVC